MNQKQIAWYELPIVRWKNNPQNGYWERDSQRQKLYDAQSVAKYHCPLLDSCGLTEVLGEYDGIAELIA